MRALGLLFAALLTVEATNVDVTYAFYNFARKYCSGGAVDNSDIGNGNIQPKFLSGKHNFLSNVTTNAEAVGAVAGDRMLSTGCDEKDGNTCMDVGERYFWCNYDQYLCMSKYAGMTAQSYSNIKTQKSTADWVFTEYFDNGLGTTQTSTFSREETVDNSYSWTLSTSVDLGFSVTVKAGIPDVMEASATTKFDIKTEESQSQSNSVTKKWSVNQQIQIPPHSTVKVEWVITKQTVSGDFKGTMKLPYYSKLWCAAKTNGHYEWFVPSPNYLPQAYPGACVGDECYISGPFNGWEGVGSYVNVTKCAYGVHC